MQKMSQEWQDVLPSRWRMIIGLVMLLALGIKLTLASTTYGTNDVSYWLFFLSSLRKLGGIEVYHRVDLFNHPPFMLHVLWTLGWLAGTTGIPFPFWLRLPAILADVASTLLVWKILEWDRPRRSSPAHIAMMAAAPASIMVAGFHGNTDPVVICFVLLSIYLLASQRPIWLAGVALGVSLNIKVVPVILLPAIILYLPNLRTRIAWLLAVGATFIAGSLPYIVQEPLFILHRLFGYSSIYGQWGLSRLAGVLPSNLNWIDEGYLAFGKVVLMVLIGVASLWMNSYRTKPPLFQQCGLVMLLFMALTPGFGVQYLAWLVPWVVLIGGWGPLLFYALSGGFLFLVYTFWSDSFPWQFANSSPWPGPIIVFEVLSWVSVVVLLALAIKNINLDYPVRRMGRVNLHLAALKRKSLGL